MPLRQLAAIAAIGIISIACDSLFHPTGDKTYVRGGVSDTAFRPVPGARIEVLDGPYAGATANSSEIGLFEFSGTANGAVRLRASRAGFETATIDAAWKPAIAILWASFLLKPIEPALAIEPGPYTLTVTSDLATATGNLQVPCEGFPADLARRTFEGTLQVSTSPMYAYQFSPLPTNSTLIKQSGQLWFGVAGQFIGFESDDAIFYEELPGFRYLQILGKAPTSEAATSTGRSITVPFHGDFWYCQTTSATAANHCSQVPHEQIVDYRSCSSVHDTMVFTKR